LKLSGKSIFGMGFAFAVASFFLLSLIMQVVFGAIFERGSIFYTIVLSLSSPIALTISVFIVKKCSKKTTRELVMVEKFHPVYAVLAITLAIGALFGLGFINIALADFFGGLGLKVSGVNPQMDFWWQYLSCVIFIAVIPAVIEEIFFRGVANALVGGGVFALIFSALCFAFYHCSIAQFCYQLICGALFFGLAVLSKSVIPCVIAHFINNFLILTFTFFGVTIDFYSWYIILIGAILLLFSVTVMVVIYIRKIKATKSEEQKAQKTTGVEWFALVSGIALCIVVTAISLV